VTPWMRAQPYLVGMALGWYMSSPRKPMGRGLAFLVWIISSACCLAVLFTIIIAYQPDYVYNATEAAFYNSLHRLVWGLSVAWVIYACSNGLGGKLKHDYFMVPLINFRSCRMDSIVEIFPTPEQTLLLWFLDAHYPSKSRNWIPEDTILFQPLCFGNLILIIGL